MSLEALSVPGSLFEAPYSSASSASRLWDRRSVFPLINASYVAPVSCHGSGAQPMSGGECQFHDLASSDSQGHCG